MGKRNYRKRCQVEGEDEGKLSGEEESGLESLEERKELQKLRKRQKGLSAAELAVGQTLPDKETQEEVDPFKSKTGGILDMDQIKDRDRDREGEEKERSISLGSSFAVETNRRDEDTHMLKYIEDQMKKKRGEGEIDGPIKQKVKSKEDALYELPDQLKVKSQLKQSEEMLSNQMLSGIPEVNLGIQAKIRNIEATEEAKMKIIEERRNKKNQGPSIMVPTNVAVDFMQHNRFYDERKSMDAEKKKQQKVAREKEETKPQGPTVTAESLGVGVDGDDDGSGSRKTGKHVDKASDDFFFEKFKNRTQDSWRYR